MSLPNFPAEVPFDSLKAIVAILSKGQVRDEWVQLVQLGAWTVGCSVGLLAGSSNPLPPEDVIVTQSFAESIDAQTAKVLALAPAEDAVSTAALNPALIIELAKLILLILQSRKG